MALFALILVTANLLIRPSELYQPLEAVSPYELSILLLFCFSFQTLLPQFQGPSLERAPLTSTFLIYFASMILCHLGNAQTQEAFDLFTEMVKMMLYYFLMVGTLTSKPKFITFLKWTTLSVGCSVLAAFLHLWHYFEIPGQENLIGEGGVRMGGTGLFKDPNDFAALAASFMPISMYFALRKNTMFLFRAFWLWLTFFFFQAIQGSGSRGGLVACFAGFFGFALSKFGLKGLLILPLIPISLVLMGGRQGDMSTSSGTGQIRIQLQLDGVRSFIRSPIFGIGPNHYQEMTGRHVAHNSFVQAYTETGFVGGATFLAMYILSLMMLRNLTKQGRVVVDNDLLALRPYLVGMLSAQIGGKMSLSHNYQVVTYMFWSMITSYANITETYPPIDKWFKNPLLAHYAWIGVAGIVFFYVYLNALVKFG